MAAKDMAVETSSSIIIPRNPHQATVEHVEENEVEGHFGSVSASSRSSTYSSVAPSISSHPDNTTEEETDEDDVEEIATQGMLIAMLLASSA